MDLSKTNVSPNDNAPTEMHTITVAVVAGDATIWSNLSVSGPNFMEAVDKLMKHILLADEDLDS